MTRPWIIETKEFGHYVMYRGSARVAAVVAQIGGWRVLPYIASRRGSRRGWPTATDAVRSYFGVDAAKALEAHQSAELAQAQDRLQWAREAYGF